MKRWMLLLVCILFLLELVLWERGDEWQAAYLLRHRIIVSLILTVLSIFLLGLLYARRRQKVCMVQMARAAGEKEKQFLALQKETELRLTRKYIEGLESERERMAAELHDDVCNNLMVLEMNIRSLSEERNYPLAEQLTLLTNIRERLRTISHELMPPIFLYATIDEMLADYILHLALPPQILAEYHSTEGVDWKQVPQEVGFEFYRIVQEAVSNVVKYAEASSIRVELNLENSLLSVLIFDDGKGFDVNKKTKGLGLRIMRQRADAISAWMELTSVIGEGTRLKVVVVII